jgi:hypothetical protein
MAADAAGHVGAEQGIEHREVAAEWRARDGLQRDHDRGGIALRKRDIDVRERQIVDAKFTPGSDLLATLAAAAVGGRSR